MGESGWKRGRGRCAWTVPAHGPERPAPVGSVRRRPWYEARAARVAPRDRRGARPVGREHVAGSGLLNTINRHPALQRAAPPSSRRSRSASNSREDAASRLHSSGAAERPAPGSRHYLTAEGAAGPGGGGRPLAAPLEMKPRRCILARVCWPGLRREEDKVREPPRSKRRMAVDRVEQPRTCDVFTPNRSSAASIARRNSC